MREGDDVDLKKWPTKVEPVYKSKEQYKKILGEHIAQSNSQQELLYASDLWPTGRQRVISLKPTPQLILIRIKRPTPAALVVAHAISARCHMIEIKIVSPEVLRLTIPEKLKAEDFRQIAPQIESLIKQHGRIRLLIDASDAT